ncbi:hypothetical protein LQW54_008639 [Pestalotiopsis sp. IQ-011]
MLVNLVLVAGGSGKSRHATPVEPEDHSQPEPKVPDYRRLRAFAQYSRTVRPGAVRVGTSDGGSGLKTTAFANQDGRIAVNVVNTGSASAALSIAGVNGTSIQAWVTDNTRDMEASPATVEAGTVTGSVPARGMVSFVVS